jgi:hypothetical protein
MVVVSLLPLSVAACVAADAVGLVLSPLALLSSQLASVLVLGVESAAAQLRRRRVKVLFVCVCVCVC